MPCIFLAEKSTGTIGSALNGCGFWWAGHHIVSDGSSFQSQNGIMTLGYSRPLLAWIVMRRMPSISSLWIVLL